MRRYDETERWKFARPAWAAAAMVALIVLAAKSLFVIATPLRALAMTPWLMDDSFIFATIARNIAEGKGCSLNGVDPTGGAPLLWTWVIALPHALLSDSEAVKACILLAASFSAVSSVIVFSITRSLTGEKAAWTAFGLSLFLASSFWNSMNAMETPLSTCLGMGVVALHFRSRGTESRRPAFFWIASGVLQGLALLARADAVFLTGSIVALELWRSRGPDKSRTAISSLSLMLGSAAILWLIQVSWNLHATGSMVASNQVGRRELAWEHLYGHGTAGVLIGYAKATVRNSIRMHNLMGLSVGSFGIAIVAMAFAIKRPDSGPATGALRSVALLTLMYLVPYAGTLILYQGYFPDFHGLRYLDLAAHLLVIPIAWFLVELVPGQLSRRVWKVGAAAVGIAGLLAGSWIGYERLMATRSWSEGMKLIPRYERGAVDAWWQFLDRARDELPEDAVVAAKDFGRLAFFTERRVVDLAGITDPRVITARKHGDLAQFLQAEEVDFVLVPVEGGFPVHREIALSLPLIPLTGFPVQEGTGYVLHRIDRARNTLDTDP